MVIRKRISSCSSSSGPTGFYDERQLNALSNELLRLHSLSVTVVMAGLLLNNELTMDFSLNKEL